MKTKRIVSLLLAGALLLSALLALSSCATKKDQLPPEGTTTRMTVDVNPSIELMVDDQNKVVSVTAMNDDGSLLIAGEEIVGKTADEAVEILVRLSAETGYLVEGTVSDGENTVKVSVSGDSEYATQLRENTKAAVEKQLEKLNISGKVEIAEALKLDALRQLALSTTSFTEEEINAMSEQELYRVLAAGRVETALLLTEDMRKAYYAAKEYEISFTEREEFAKILAGAGALQQILYITYKTALDSYGNAITSLDELRYRLLVSPESEYQKSLVALREAKVELLKQKTFVASLEEGDTQLASATVTLQLSEEKYDAALALYERLGTEANAAIEQLITTLRAVEVQLAAIEERFTADIQAEMTAKASEIEQAVNQKKDAFFAEFEEAHRDDIKAIEAELLARKQELLASVGEEK